MIDLTRIQPKIKNVAEKYHLDFVVLFGSQAIEKTHPKSDVDIAVISRSPIDIIDITNAMYTVFGREDVEVVDLSSASPTLMYIIVRDGKLLHERQPAGFLRWKLYAIKIWMETSWLRELQKKKLLRWANFNT